MVKGDLLKRIEENPGRNSGHLKARHGVPARWLHELEEEGKIEFKGTGYYICATHDSPQVSEEGCQVDEASKRKDSACG